MLEAGPSAPILPELIEAGSDAGAPPAIRCRGAGALPANPRDRAGHPRYRQRRRRRAGETPIANAAGAARVAPDWCYLSSGTWSLIGVEVPRPVITSETMKFNFTNEGGVAGTTRLLKNIMGLWLVQECRRIWSASGLELSYDGLTARAQAAPPFAALVDPDDTTFLAHGDMPRRLAAYCSRTGQTLPDDHGAIVRSCLESLALKYRWAVDRLERILSTSSKTIHVVGGGSKNALLCQFTADACGRPVHAGPAEATAIGNILMQALGRGQLGSIAELRAVVAHSFPVKVYEPRETARWSDAMAKFNTLVGI